MLVSLDAIQNQLECLLAGWMFWAGLSLLITSAVEGLALVLLFFFFLTFLLEYNCFTMVC